MKKLAKRILAALLCVLIILSLTACGGSKISGTWKYSIEDKTSIVKFKSDNTVICTIKNGSEKTSIEGTYFFDEETEKVTVTLPGVGTKTYDVDLSIPQIDFMDLPHRK